MGVYENARKQTKNKIINTFWELYKEQRIDKITITAITKLCGIHRSTFYLYFHDTYEILEEIESNLIKNIEKINIEKADTSDGIITIGKLTFNEIRENHEYLNILLVQQRDSIFANKYLEKFKEKVKGAVGTSEASLNPLQASACNFIVSAIVNSLIFCANDLNFSYEDTVKLMKGLMLNGYYITMRDKFKVQDLKNPFKEEYWSEK